MANENRKAKPISKALRFAVLTRDNYTCQYCGATPQNGALELDHIIPVTEGGLTEADNLITSCEPCNKGKGASTHSAPLLPDMTSMTAESDRRRMEIEAWRVSHRKTMSAIEEAADVLRRSYRLDISAQTLSSAVTEYGIEEVAYAAKCVDDRDLPDSQAQRQYLYGVLRNRKRDGSQIPKKVDRDGCPFGFGNCWTDAEAGTSGIVDGCLIEGEDGDECCMALIDAMGGWQNKHLLHAASRFTSAWRKGGPAVVDFIKGNIERWEE